MANALLNLEPQKVSTNIESYSTLIYGPPKIGKSKFVQDLFGDRVLNIFTEKRFKHLGGIRKQYITNWVEFLRVMQEIKDPRVHEQFDVISIDTVENLYDMLEKYVASTYKEKRVGERNDLWGEDWTALKSMWKDGLLKIEQAGYVACFVSHSVQETVQIPASGIIETDKEGITSYKETIDKNSGQKYLEFLKYKPDMRDKVMSPINKMVDNILFLSLTADSQGGEHRIINTRESLQWLAGSTFENIKSPIPLSAESYREAVQEAVEDFDDDLKTEERAANADLRSVELNFEELQEEAQQLAKGFVKAKKMELVTAIVDDTFGTGEKLTSATPQQVEVLAVAVQRMKQTAEEQGIDY